jgi:hypothetical protein
MLPFMQSDLFICLTGYGGHEVFCLNGEISTSLLTLYLTQSDPWTFANTHIITPTLPVQLRGYLSKMCLNNMDTPLPALSLMTRRPPSRKMSKIPAPAMTLFNTACLKITTAQRLIGNSLKILAPMRTCLTTKNIPLLALPSTRPSSSSCCT